MKSQGFEWSDSLEFIDSPENVISVKASSDLKEGDVVAKIPKRGCLTIKTSGAREIIESSEMDGCLGLAMAIMYEKSLGEESPWAGYLQLLPDQECIPLVWTLDEVDSLLIGTELHKAIKEDKAIIYEDWKENILPLIDSSLQNLDPCFFGVEEYFAARSLIASRSFQIDDYHGSGMVPLADLFNHKTGAEDVHFTNVSSDHESDDDADEENGTTDVHAYTGNDEQINEDGDSDKNESASAVADESNSESSLVSRDDSMALEMIMIKDVKAGAEVFNTYGLVGNAALLHRYGFTEPDNQYNILNIDLELVLQWGSSLFSSRYCRSRLSLWRRLDYSGCESDNSEYFEISPDGEPQIELLVLLYIILLPDHTFHKLDLAISANGNANGCVNLVLNKIHDATRGDNHEMIKDILLTESVCDALLRLADMRESLYGSTSMKDDIEALKRCGSSERKLYHSLVLRISERKILEKLRNYAASSAKEVSSESINKSSRKKRLKRK